MKTVSRMIFCYLLAAFGIAFLVLTVNGALLIGVVLHYGAKGQQEGFFPVGKFAESFTRTDDGFAPAPDMEWQKHFAWAMLLGDDGEILWSENLPEELNHAYTVPEVAAFSRWYLKDYPVMAYRNDFGLLVAGKEQGSMTRFDFYMDNDILYPLLSGVGPLLIVDLCLVAAICLILGWRGAKPLREAAAGIGQLAEGKEVHLPQSGAAAELAEKLNEIGNTTGSLCLVIGSSHGLSPRVKNTAAWRLSVSRLTFPHQMMRVILLETLYRSLSILAGTKYHK